MEVEQQKGMQTKWMLHLLLLGFGICSLDKMIGSDCFSKDWISSLSLTCSFLGGLVLLGVFLAVLNRFDYMVVDNALDNKNSAKKLSSFTIFSYVFCVFVFGSIIIGGVVNSGLDLMILFASDTPVEFKAKVSEVDTTPKSGRGSCHGVQYTFHNSPVDRDTAICDTQGSMTFLKNGDVLLIHENIGSVGAHFLSAQQQPS